MRFLVIEDQNKVSQFIKKGLEEEGYAVDIAHDGREGLDMAFDRVHDLIILDIQLPKMDGLQVLHKLRGRGITTPVLLLTVRATIEDKVLGLDSGADDYLTKPFSIREFIARTKAILRRVEAIQKEIGSDADIKVSDLVIEASKRKVTLKGERIELTPKEFDLLHLLASHPGKTYTREQLLNILWGYQYNGYEHTVNSHINRLRSKIEPDISKPKFILTSWGVGYRFNEEIS